MRFTDLQNQIHGVNSNTLTFHLRELEEKKILSRMVFPGIPPRVEYSLTGHGKAIFPVFDALRVWGVQNPEFEGMKMDIC
ncbi:MAG: helix-turn-helix transcriptional regulator [Methanospirillum sp.]|nr:helix-turn-helix transcriptional regulator [Methanospirillum sp.]